MKNYHKSLFAGLIVFNSALSGAEIFVSATGDNNGTGELSAPLRSIQGALERAKPGDTVYLRAGIFRESVSLKSKSGKDGAPITVRAYGPEKPVISGLDVLRLDWKVTEQPGIYAASFEAKSIAQLFFNGKPMLEARWPHCPKDKNGDWNFFSPDIWASGDTEGNSYGTLSCAALAKTGWDVTGAQALLNVDHQFFCWTRPVRTHAVGSAAFTYDQDLGEGVNKRDEGGVLGKWNQGNKFYLFGLKQFLGARGEWFYDAAAKQLLICSPNGKSPSEGLLEIKSRPWAFTADETCNYLTIDGVGFFGTAFKFGDNPKKRSSHIVLRNSSVLYSSWTEYLSTSGGGKKGADDGSADFIYPTIMSDNSQVVNSTFSYGALSALLVNGLNNLIENDLFQDFDYSSSLRYPPLQVNVSGNVAEGQAGHTLIRWNTLCRSGGIQARMLQPGNEFTMNDVRDSYLACYGGNKDTSAVYTQRPTCTGTRIHHNWVHEGYSGTPPLPWGGGTGIRGDDLTCGLTVDHNVVWNCGSVGITIKNVNKPTPEEANRCVSNTVFDHSAFNKIKSAIIIPTVPGKAYWPDPSGLVSRPNEAETPNAWSTVANNLAEPIYGMWFAKPLGKLNLAGGNCASFDPRTDLAGKDWYDFRPASNASRIVGKGVAIDGLAVGSADKAPDVGAYERGDSVYWIPGRRERKASFPIVPDGARGVPAGRDALMWRPAYGAVSHRLLFSTSREGLAQTTATRVEKNFTGEENVFLLPKLKPGTAYFWRVDVVKADASVVEGEIWTFTTEPGA